MVPAWCRVELGRLLGFDIPERVAGIDLFMRLLQLAERGEGFFLGAAEQVVEKAVAEIRTLYPDLKIAGWHRLFLSRSVWSCKDQRLRRRDVVRGTVFAKKENFIRSLASVSLPRDRFGHQVSKIDSPTRQPLLPGRPASVPLRQHPRTLMLASQHYLK